jgi:hypothetical protein
MELSPVEHSAFRQSKSLLPFLPEDRLPYDVQHICVWCDDNAMMRINYQFMKGDDIIQSKARHYP